MIGNGEQIVTYDDHEAGFKDVEVTFRSGRKQTIRLTAPDAWAAGALRMELVARNDPRRIVKACLPADVPLDSLRNLTPNSASLLSFVAYCLTFGLDDQKKMEAAGAKALESLAKIFDAPTPSSSEADSTPATFAPGA